MSFFRIIQDPFNLGRLSDLELFSKHLNVRLNQAYDHILQIKLEKRVQFIVRKHERFQNGYHKSFTIVHPYENHEDAFYEADRLNKESKFFHYTVQRLEAT